MRNAYLLIILLLWNYNSVVAQEIISLYPKNEILFAKSDTEIPTLTYYPAKQQTTDIVIIVCSGGSYHGRANDVEGIPTCKMLNENGISTFLLDYRVPNAKRMDHKEIVPLTDAQKAILYVKNHAEKYKVNPNKLGIIGFSAGGHLVTTVATHFNQTALKNTQGKNLRPDFVVAVYPVISFENTLTHEESRMRLIGPDITSENIYRFSNDKHITHETPPTFLVAALDDDVVKVQNSLYYEAALRQHRVPVNMFLYAKGGHGFGIYNKTANVQWTPSCVKWILSEQWKKQSYSKQK
ncbi:alpha/beta hydrolase [Zhouia sp. PK063]|uniref:alpha/beta hydrolase n=1 Tax=Zhouia sp. PK063 TaxID=3373602 RepID=UPI0037B0BD4E